MGMEDAMEEKLMLRLMLSRFAQPVWTPLFGRLILVEPIPQSQPTISSRMMADLLMTTELLRLFGIWKSPQEQLPSVGEFSLLLINTLKNRNYILNYYWLILRKKQIAFCWRIFRNRLPTKANLRKRHITLPSYRCPLCDSEEEDIGHIMFSCRMTRNLWWEALRWVNRVGPFPIEHKNHFMQFSHWNRKSFIDNRWVIKMLLSVNWVCIILSVCKKQKRKEVPINHNIWRATGLCGLESNALFGGASG